jgi:hypothetical protein
MCNALFLWQAEVKVFGGAKNFLLLLQFIQGENNFIYYIADASLESLRIVN